MPEKTLTQKRLKELLHYNPSTGVFTWLIRRGGTAKIGTIAGSKCKRGYVAIAIDLKLYRAHRLAWLYVYGYLPEHGIDHIKRDRSDNRIEKLREASSQCNTRNTGNWSINTSGVKGVFWQKARGKWQSQITVNKHTTYLGTFSEFDEAVFARLAAEQCLNWNRCDSLSPAHRYVSEKIVHKRSV